MMDAMACHELSSDFSDVDLSFIVDFDVVSRGPVEIFQHIIASACMSSIPARL